jgi:RNA polymerase sigma-70 factor (ECF subfamily)
MAALRLRRPYGELLREEIARTVADPADIEDEIRSLFAAPAP